MLNSHSCVSEADLDRLLSAGRVVASGRGLPYTDSTVMLGDSSA